MKPIAHYIGVGTRGAGGQAPPIFYPQDFINIHLCSADCCNQSAYYVRPLQNVIASYAYAILNSNNCALLAGTVAYGNLTIIWMELSDHGEIFMHYWIELMMSWTVAVY